MSALQLSICCRCCPSFTRLPTTASVGRQIKDGQQRQQTLSGQCPAVLMGSTGTFTATKAKGGCQLLDRTGRTSQQQAGLTTAADAAAQRAQVRRVMTACRTASPTNLPFNADSQQPTVHHATHPQAAPCE